MTKEKQLEKIQNKINELYDLLENYMKDATEEEKQAIPLYKSVGGDKGLTSLLYDFNLVYFDWIDREDFQNRLDVKTSNIDDVINQLDEELNIFDDSSWCAINDIIKEVETENEG